MRRHFTELRRLLTLLKRLLTFVKRLFLPTKVPPFSEKRGRTLMRPPPGY
jgi:hypothetical protein